MMSDSIDRNLCVALFVYTTQIEVYEADSAYSKNPIQLIWLLSIIAIRVFIEVCHFSLVAKFNVNSRARRRLRPRMNCFTYVIMRAFLCELILHEHFSYAVSFFVSLAQNLYR